MCAMKLAGLVALVALAGCGSSARPGGDGGPGVDPSRASRGGGLPDALTSPGPDTPAGGGGGATPPAGAGGSAGTAGSARAPGLDGPADGPAPAEAAPEVAPDLAAPESGPSACEQGGACERLNKEYVEALARARSCEPAGAAQCLEMAPELLECPDCPVWVNSAKETTALQAQAAAAGCNRCLARCPERPCRALRRGACQPTGGILFPTGHACGEAGLLP